MGERKRHGFLFSKADRFSKGMGKVIPVKAGNTELHSMKSIKRAVTWASTLGWELIRESQEGNAKSSNGVPSIRGLACWWSLLIWKWFLKMRRTNYPFLLAEIRGNLLAIGVYDTKAHWQMWPQFSVSAFPESSALSLTMIYVLQSHLPGGCVQNQAADLHRCFSSHLLASLASIWNGRKIITCPTLHMQKRLTIIRAWHSSQLPREVSQYRQYSLGVRLCSIVSVMDRAEARALPIFSPCEIQPPTYCLVRV